jgi:hypothetical protein
MELVSRLAWHIYLVNAKTLQWGQFQLIWCIITNIKFAIYKWQKSSLWKWQSATVYDFSASTNLTPICLNITAILTIKNIHHNSASLIGNTVITSGWTCWKFTIRVGTTNFVWYFLCQCFNGDWLLRDSSGSHIAVLKTRIGFPDITLHLPLCAFSFKNISYISIR